MFFFLLFHFSRNQIVEAPSYIDTDSKASDFGFRKKGKDEILKIDIKLTSQIQPGKELRCIEKFPIRKFSIYQSNTEQNKSNHLISVLSNSSIIFSLVSNHLLSNGFNVTNVYDDLTSYVLSLSDNIFLPNFSKVNQSSFSNNLPNLISLYIYSDSSFPQFCTGLITPAFSHLSKLLLVIFVIFSVVRLAFLSTRIKIPGDLEGYIFFSDFNGSPLIFMPMIIFKYWKQFYELLQKVYKSRSNSNVILEYENFPSYFGVTRLHAYYVTDKICLLLIFKEVFVETVDDSTHGIDNSILITDESSKHNEVKINVNYRSNQYSTAELHFSIDDVDCKITLRPNNSSLYPFGGHSLLLSYLDCIHLGALNESIKLDTTLESFKRYLMLIYERLDFKGLSIFVDDKNGKKPVFEYYANEEVHQLTLKCLENIPVKLISDMKTSTYQNKNYLISGNSFKVASHSYFLMIALDSKKFLFRHSERRFIFILSILVSFHHSLISSKGESRVLSRIYKLLESTECFAIVECISTPRHFHSTHGNLFGEKVNQETLDMIFSKIEDTKIKATLPLKHPKMGDVWITITSTQYFDKTLQETVYMYLIEDITRFHERTLQLNAAHESGQMAAYFLGLHKINKDFTLDDPISFSSELGYSKPIKKLDEIIFKEDLPKFNNMKNLITFRVISALGHPVWYSAITKCESQKNFFVFSSREISQIQAISQSQACVLKDLQKRGSFMLATIEIEFGTIEPVITTERFVSTQAKCLQVDKLTEIFIPEDVGIFKNALDDIKTDRIYEKTLLINAKLNTDIYEAFMMYLLAAPNQKVILFMSNVDKKQKKRAAIMRTNAELDLAFQNSKMILFVFEDTQMPERIFVTQPLCRNQMIFNWPTLFHNVKAEYIEKTRDALSRCLHERVPYNILVPMIFETTKWYLFRGRVMENNNHITGNAIDLSVFVDNSEKTKKQIIEMEKEIINENKILKQTRELIDSVIEALIPLCEVYTDFEYSEENNELTKLLITTYKTLHEQAELVPYI